MDPLHLSRRDLLAVLVLGGGALAPLTRTRADTAPRVDPKDPAAQALGYVENAARVDRQKYPSYVPGSTCDNCLQLEGKPGNEYRPCKIFQSKLVAVGGWCTAWTAEV